MLLASLALVATSVPAVAEQMKLLWEIGKADNDSAEFALGRGGFREFDRDGLFTIGRSDPKQDWPYTHPGPSDAWAGAQAHTFTAGMFNERVVESYDL